MKVVWTLFLAVFFLYLAMACNQEEDSDSKDNDSSNTTTTESSTSDTTSSSDTSSSSNLLQGDLTGIVSDGPVAGATVRFLDPKTGQFLKDANGQEITVQTGNDGRFSISFTVPEELLGRPLLLKASGGVDTGGDQVLEDADLDAIPLGSAMRFDRSEFTPSPTGRKMIASREAVVSPVTTLLARKIQLAPETTLDAASTELAGQLPITKAELLADPTKNATTAEVAQSIAVAVQLVESANVDNDTTVDADAIFDALALSQEDLLALEGDSEELVWQTEALVTALQDRDLLSDTEAATTRVIVNASRETMTNLAKEVANQVSAQVSGNQEAARLRAIASLETGARSLSNMVTAFKNANTDGSLTAGQLSVMADALAGSVLDRMAAITQSGDSHFEALSIEEVNEEASENEMTSDDATTVVGTFQTWFADSTTVASQVAASIDAGSLDEDSTANIRLKAIQQTLADVTRTLESFEEAITNAGLTVQDIVDVAADMVETTIDDSFIQGMQDSVNEINTTQDKLTFSQVARISSASIAQSLISFIKKSVSGSRFSDLQSEATAGSGTLLTNAVQLSQQGATNIITELASTSSSEAPDQLLANANARKRLVDASNIVERLTDSQGNSVLFDSIDQTVFSTASSAVESDLATGIERALELLGIE